MDRWEPLRAALAWRVTDGDEEFAAWVGNHTPFSKPTVLVRGLRHQMHEVGCFVSLLQPREQQALVNDYAGRFQSLAEGFEAERCVGFSNSVLHLDDYLLRRVNNAAREICQCILEKKLTAEGLAIVDGIKWGIERLPSVAITETMTLREDSDDGVLCAGPTIADGRCWKSVRVSWAGLMKCFPPAKPTIRAEADCKRWLQRLMKTSPDRRLREKRDLLPEARTKFLGLSDRAFNRAWLCAATAADAGAWTKGGAPRRPRKSPH